jgi:hypothetical protein
VYFVLLISDTSCPKAWAVADKSSNAVPIDSLNCMVFSFLA